MKLLTGIVAIITLTTASQAFAGDITSDRYFAQSKSRRTAAATSPSEARPTTEAQGSLRFCDCAPKGEHSQPRADASAR
jgi:hypothetical protein